MKKRIKIWIHTDPDVSNPIELLCDEEDFYGVHVWLSEDPMIVNARLIGSRPEGLVARMVAGFRRVIDKIGSRLFEEW